VNDWSARLRLAHAGLPIAVAFLLPALAGGLPASREGGRASSGTSDASSHRPTVVTDATGSTTVHYDPVLKRLTSVQTLLGGRTYTVSFGYAGDGQVLSMTTPAGTTSYGYDAAGRLVLMTAPAGDTTSWTYDGAGRVLSESTLTTAGRTITTAYRYGPSGQPGDPSTAPAHLRTIAQTVNGQTFKIYTLTHSYLGQTTAVSASGGTSGEVENDAFAYDARGRLTADSETVTVFGTPYGASGSYQWDLSSNLQGGTGGWTYNANNQVTSAPPMGGLAGATGLGYDASGNLTSANGMGLSWDAWGNLSGVTGAPGNPSFTYDAFGRRASKTVGGVTTYYLYAGSMLVCELDANGNVLRSYNWGALGLVSEYTTSVPRYYLFDDRGDTRAVLDANGTVIARGAYTAWGSPVPGLNPGVAMGWKGRYGVYTDAETGLVHMGARYYAPCIGSFISRDPIGFAGGINLYGYCYGDPINYVDPDGEDAADTIRLIADGASFIPGLNVPASLVSGGISLYKRDFVGAALAGVSLVPFGRWAVAGVQAIRAARAARAVKYVRVAAEVTRVARVAAKPAQVAEFVRDTAYALRNAQRLGRQGEAILAGLGLAKNKQHIRWGAIWRVPDVFDTGQHMVGEVKNVARLALTKQLQDYLAIADHYGYEFRLFIRSGTVLSGPLGKLEDAGRIVVRRPLP
jgi:RHS repeat-associated protein